MARNFVPRQDGQGNIGTAAKNWDKGYFKELVTSKITCDEYAQVKAAADLVPTKADKVTVDTLSITVTQKADKSYVDTAIAALGNGSPKGTYATLAALQADYPTGTTGIFVVTADGNWYYWNGSTWISGGTYQSTGIADGSITNTKIAQGAITDDKLAATTNIAIKTIGKNLIALDKATTGYYVSYLSGNLVANENYTVTEYIHIQPSTNYTLSSYNGGPLEQLAFYDVNKQYISGLSNVGTGIQVTFQTPSNASYVRITMRNSRKDTTQLELGNAMTSFEQGGYRVSGSDIQKNSLTDEHIKDDPSSRIVMKRVGKNLLDLDPAKLTVGYYPNYLTGNLSVSAAHSATDYIEILPSTTYSYSAKSTLEQFAFYDANKQYISGNIGSANPIIFTTPANAKYIRLTIRNTAINDDIQLEQSDYPTYYQPYGYKIPLADIREKDFTLNHFVPEVAEQLSMVIKTIITVKKDGSGDFTNLRAALESITDASASKQYQIQVFADSEPYDILADYTADEINATSFIGPIKPNYVEIVGIGDKNKVILKGELADTFPAATMSRVSTICTYGNGGFKNLIITAKNLRYAVHDDYPFTDYERVVEDCKFIHYAGVGGYGQAWGEGCRSGSRYEFKNCEFYTELETSAYSTHNNINFSKPTYHRFENCKFSNLSGKYGIRFGSMGSGQREIVDMIGCKITGDLYIMEEQSNGVGIDFDVRGYGNDIVPYNIVTTTSNQYTYNFIGECKEMKNVSASTITKGTPVKMKADYSGVEPMGVSDSALLCYGVAFQDIESGGTGIIKISGYLRISDTPLSGLVVGDKIGIVNGTLAKVASGDYIGVVTLSNYIKLVNI